MRRHAKALSAASIFGTGESRGLFGRAFATRGPSGDSKGSGAPSNRRGSLALVLIAAFLLALMAAPGAQAATKQVISAFGSTSGSPALGGTFNNVGGTAVYNQTGDIYVADRGNHRIQQLSAAGNFIRAWGQDVDTAAGTGFEICTVAANCKVGITTAQTGGALSAPQGIAIDQATGNVYVTNQGFKRVEEYSSTGTFIRAFGQGVVASGPDNADAKNAKQTVTIAGATGGTFTLSFRGKTTSAIPWNATAAELKTALEAISTIGIGSVTVAGGPGGSAALEVTFTGGLASTPVPALTANNAALTPPGATATVATEAGQTGFEICNTTDVCTTGTATGTGGSFNTAMGYPAVVPAGASNAGNVLVPDTTNLRMQEFTATGTFVRAFGADVVNVGTDNGGAGTTNEVQKVNVAGTSGTFTLTFGAATTTAIPYNASASQVEAALNALSTIGGSGGFVTVTGGPGDATGSNPYVVTFGGSKGGTDVAQITINAITLGTPVGTQLTCAAGPASAKTLSYQWLRNGVAIGGATASTYTSVAADEGKAIQCQTFASGENPSGGTAVGPVSTAVPVISPYPGTVLPAATVAPAATIKSGTLPVGGSGGAVLACSTGTWTGGPTFGYQWYRNAVALSGNGAGTNEYTVQTADLATTASFQCVVTGTNVGGATVRSSANLNTATAPSPLITAAATVTSSATPSATSTTTPGVSVYEICLPANDTCKAGVSGSAGGVFGANSPTRVAVDGSGSIYAVDPGNSRLQKFNPAATAVSTYAAATLSGGISDVAVDLSSDHVYVVKNFGEGSGTPPVFNGPETRVLQFDNSTNLIDSHGVAGKISSVTGLSVAAANAGAGAGTIYLSSTSGKQRVLGLGSPVPPTSAVTSVSGIEPHGATFNGTVNPNGLETTYHFEYSSDGGLNWSAAAADALAGSGVGAVPVTQTATGLLANLDYQVRLVVTKLFNPPVQSSSQSFKTTTAGPVVSTPGTGHIVAGSSSVTFSGAIDPNYESTQYHFEYGETTAYGTNVPSPESTVGGGGSQVPVKQVIEGLTPGVTYHFRLVAHNPTGEAKSPDVTFIIPVGGGARAYELVSPADALAYDVSAIQYAYRPVGWSAQLAAASSGDAFLGSVRINGSFGDMIRDGDSLDPLVSTRTASGWKSFAPLGTKTLNDTTPLSLSADGRHTLLALSYNFPGGSHDKTLIGPKDPLSGDPLDASNDALARGSFYNVDNDTDQADWVSGKYDATGQLMKRTVQISDFVGSSPDLSTSYFGTLAGLLPGLPDGASYLYRHDASGTVLISRQADGTPAGNISQANAPNAVTATGDAITFGTSGILAGGDTNSVEDVYQVRRGESGDEVIRASGTAFTGAAQTAVARTFQGASTDGSRIFFSTTEKMVGDGTATGDLNTVNDIYEYDQNAPVGSRLSRVSVMDPSCSSSPGTCNDNLSNTGATNTSAAKFSMVSDDGSHVFFLSGNVLNPADTDAQQSLYVRDTVAGTTAYVAPAGVGATSATNGTDAATAGGEETRSLVVAGGSRFRNRLLRVSADGSVAAFLLATNTSLPGGRGGADSDEALDLYVWTESDGLRRVPQGPVADANTITSPSLGCVTGGLENGATVPPACRVMPDDGGQVFFQTTDSLVGSDTNGSGPVAAGCRMSGPGLVPGCDVYAYNTASHSVELISAGDGAASGFIDVDTSGDNVFFSTGDTLDPSRDTDSGHFDIYDARVGGGFPPAVKDPGCDAVAEECQGPASKYDSLPTPPSRNDNGAGNPPTPPPSCGKGKVRKHGKCVKKQKKKQHKKQSGKKHQKRAGNNSGGGK